MGSQVRIVIVVSIAVVAFWAGYDLCAYRYLTYIAEPTARAGALHHADMLLKMTDLLDTGDTATLRRKLMVVAHTELTVPINLSPSSRDYLSWTGLVSLARGPLEDYRPIAAYFADDIATLGPSVKDHLAALCAKSPAGDADRQWCATSNKSWSVP
jgi:hypothetical protein